MNIKSIKDGDKIEIGDEAVLEAIHTPGHTNGSMSFRLQIIENRKIRDNNDNIDKNNIIMSISSN